MCKEIENCACGCSGKITFSDFATIDKTERTIVSVRDGVQEYLGLEIGQNPPHKIFKVYRSPKTVAQLVKLIDGLPITNDHVDIDFPATNVVSKVNETELIENEDETVDSTIAIRNKIADSDSVLQLLNSGNKQLSLAGRANLIQHEIYDFEQTDIEPHHIAILERGRCGDACSFLDGKLKKGNQQMLKLTKILMAFKDQDGEVTLQQVMEMVQALPEAIKTVPVEMLKELAPVIQNIIDIAKESGVDIVEDVAEQEAEQVETADENSTETDVEDMDGKVDVEDMDGKVDVEDEEMPDDEKVKMADGVILFSDAQVKKISEQAVEKHSKVIEHARKFVDHSYDFSGKSTADIQREIIQQECPEQKFADHELDVAFKLLKPKSGDYAEFGDKAPEHKLDELKEQEL